MSLHCAAETYIKIKVPGADGAEGKAMSFMYFLAVLIGPLVKILYSFIGNYAATMIVATLILKLLLFPLSIHQQKSTAKMSVFQPLITEIQQKYKNDPQKQQEELMKLQQEHGYNPMGGCMPMLLTMLVLFGFLGVVYYPVHYIFGVSNEAVKAACEAIGLATTNTSTMQTALIQAIHNGASIDPSIISASVVAEIQNFNTSFFGMDMCDVPGFHLTPIAIFPAIATVTMFVSYFITQKLSGISRCIGTPGDTLLVDSLFSVSSPEAQLNPDKKRLYTYPAAKEQLITSLMQTLSITNDGLMGSNDSTHVRSFSRYEYYLLEQAISDQNWIQPLTEKSEKELKPLIVPGKGKALRVYPWNITLLRNTLVMHEGKQAEIKNDTLYIDGKPTQHCFFTKDYYWMASNNSVNLSDSRLFGFVPQDHIIGKASLIWFSKEKGTGIFDGYRWNRFFQSVK